MTSFDRDDIPTENGRTPGGAISDMMKKALFAGIGAIFMTEESIRGYLAETKFPRDVRNYVVQNADKLRAELFAYITKELSQLFMRSDLPKVIRNFLESHTIELEAKIRFRKNEDAPEAVAGPVEVDEVAPPPPAMSPPPPASQPPLAKPPRP